MIGGKAKGKIPVEGRAKRKRDWLERYPSALSVSQLYYWEYK